MEVLDWFEPVGSAPHFHCLTPHWHSSHPFLPPYLTYSPLPLTHYHLPAQQRPIPELSHPTLLYLWYPTIPTQLLPLLIKPRFILLDLRMGVQRGTCCYATIHLSYATVDPSSYGGTLRVGLLLFVLFPLQQFEWFKLVLITRAHCVHIYESRPIFHKKSTNVQLPSKIPFLPINNYVSTKTNDLHK